MSLWRAYCKGEMPIAKFLTECAYLALNYGFDDLVPHDFPQRPQELIDYDQMGFDKRSNVEPSFWRQPVVFNYCEEKQRVKNWNKSTKEWLEEILSYLPEDDLMNRQKVKDRLKEFSEYPENTQLVKTIFGGRDV